jgi:hypothetical protein
LRFHDQTMAPFPTRCRLNPQTELGNWFRAPLIFQTTCDGGAFVILEAVEAIGAKAFPPSRARCKRAHDARFQNHPRPHRPLGNRSGPRDPRPGGQQVQAVLRRRRRFRRGSQRAGEPGRRGHARHAAGAERLLRRAGGEDGPGPEGADQSEEPLRPQELLLSRPAARLSDQPVRPADRRRGRRHGRARGRLDLRRAHRAPAPGTGRRQVAARPGSERDLCRPEPRGHGADGDRLQARHAHLGRGGGLCEEDPHDPRLSGHLRRRHGEGQPARRRQRLGLPSRRLREVPRDRQLQPPRHALRDQERQLVPLHPAGHRVRGPSPDRDPGRRRQDRSGNPPVRSDQERDPLDAVQGRGARLSLLPRSGPAAADPRRRLGQAIEGHTAGTAGRQEGAPAEPVRPVGL